MNPDIKMIGDYNLQDRILKLTSKGYSTREAKRKIERDDRKKFNKFKRKSK